MSTAWTGIAIVLRLALGGVFIFAAVVKLADPRALAVAIKAFKIVPDHLSILFAYVVPWSELIFAVAIVLGLWTRAAATLLVITLGVFIAAMLSVISRGMDVDCSCFGSLTLFCKQGVSMCGVWRNVVFAAAALALVVGGGGRVALDRFCGPARRAGAKPADAPDAL